MARVTSNEVALRAKVDRSTVSRVLSGRQADTHRYAQGTIRRIQQAASELGYRPSPTAVALRTGKSMLVGMIVSDIANPFFGEMISRVEGLVRKRGYRLMVCNSGENPELQAEHLSDMVDRGVDAIVFSPSGARGSQIARDQGVPLVTLDRALSDLGLPHVGLDQFRAGQMLGEHLRERGYHQVAVAMPDTSTDPTLAQRLEGLRQGLADETGSDRIAWIERVSQDDIRGQVRARVFERLDKAQTPQAIVGLTNFSTIGAFQAVVDQGLTIPQRLGVAGIDDFSSATILNPPITVVAQPLAQMAAKVAQLVLQTIDNADNAGQTQEAREVIEPQSHLLEPRLLIRESL